MEICLLLNTDPDKPRNLAKTVTVGWNNTKIYIIYHLIDYSNFNFFYSAFSEDIFSP